MTSSIIGVVLSVTLLAATTRASHYAEPPRSDEPAARASTVENENKKQEPGITPPGVSISKPTQAQSKEARRTREIKNRLRQMGLARRITVVLLNGNERYGSIERIDDESFQLAEVDINQEVIIFYKDVKKVRTGYGNFIPITGRRINPKWELFAKIAFAVFIIIIVPLSVPRT